MWDERKPPHPCLAPRGHLNPVRCCCDHGGEDEDESDGDDDDDDGDDDIRSESTVLCREHTQTRATELRAPCSPLKSRPRCPLRAQVHRTLVLLKRTAAALREGRVQGDAPARGGLGAIWTEVT